MNKKQSNRLSMAKTLRQFFSDAQEKYSDNNPLKIRVAELDTVLNKLDGIASVQGTDTTAHTHLKTDARTLMIDLTVAYANSAADYFDDKDSPLARQLTISKAKIKDMTGVNAKIYCNTLHSIVSENMAVLSPVYIKVSEAESWLESINSFDAKTYDAGVSKDATQNATQNLEDGFKELSLCLKKLDRIMKKYDVIDRSFYRNYRISRKISDLGTRHDTDVPVQP